MSYVYRPPPEPSRKEKIKRMAQQVGMGLGMGAFVGTTVAFLHTAMADVPKGTNKWTGFGKRALGVGASFGCIFAVGGLIRPS